jgi:hypothetical protein
MIETVSISELYFRNLVNDSLELQALEAAGVDNWIGYGEVSWPTKEMIDAEVQAAKENPA